MNGKCFCHLSGLAVKDAKARARLEAIEKKVEEGGTSVIPEGYIKPEGSLTITENGSHDVRDKESVIVDVPAEVITEIPEGYIKPSGSKTITTNGSHDVTNVKTVDVDVPTEVITEIPEGYIKPSGSKTITSNGSHDVRDKESVIVDVPAGITPTGTLYITSINLAEYQGKTIDISQYASLNINISTFEDDWEA